MLNFKPRLLHAAILVALPTLLAAYPHEDAFAQISDSNARFEKLKKRPVLNWIKDKLNHDKPKTPSTPPPPSSQTEPTIWLAQNHIQLLNHPQPHITEPNDGNFDPYMKFAEDKLNKYLGTTGEKMLKLTGGRDALLKLDIKQDMGFSNPEVKATLYNKDGAFVWEGSATKPAVEPTSFEHSPGKVVHVLDQSFRLMLPGQHLATGTKLKISVQDPNPAKRPAWVEDFELNVGAPTVLPITMIDWKIFGGESRILPEPVVKELGRKLPIKELALQRLDAIVDEAVFYPIGDVPYIRATSFNDWLAKAQKFSPSLTRPINEKGVDLSQAMLTAMQNAGNQERIRVFHGNYNDGTTMTFNGRGGDGMVSSSTNARQGGGLGVFAHEFSHNFNLWHWQDRNNLQNNYADKQYPYDGAMFGILPNESKLNTDNRTHNGPTWHYSPPTSTKPFGEAIAPFYTNTEGNKVYRRVISTSGSFEDRPGNNEIGVFSDFDNRVSQDRLEKVLRVYNTQTKSWATWNQTNGSYSKPVGGTPGINLPSKPEPESVLSLVFATSIKLKDANLAYRPIGPYNSGIRFLYDPQNATQRTQAKDRAYCPAAKLSSDGGCDYSVKVVQGGVARLYMLPIDDSTNNLTHSIPDNSVDAVKHVAINVLRSDGTVTEMTIYSTPNVERTPASANINLGTALFTRTFN